MNRKETLARAAIITACALIPLLSSACSVTTAVLRERDSVLLSAARPPAPEPEPEPEPPPRVEVEAERIRVDEKIHFEIDSAEISSQSDGLLQEIAQVMNDNPHVRKIRIEGHTDNQGAAQYNLGLSRRRARAVMERLVQNGVEAGRMEAEGYGLTRPVESNDTAQGRAANRRVEFNILEQDATVPAPAEGQASDTQQQEQQEQQPAPSVRTGAQASGGAQ